MIHQIKLTKCQADLAEWAIDPMADAWREWVEDGEADEIPELPYVKDGILYLPDSPDVIEDFLYRLEEQFPDIAREGSRSIGIANLGTVRSAQVLAAKIRAI